MKSVLLALTVATVSLSLAACGPTPDPSKNNANNLNNSMMNNTSTNNTSTNSNMNNTSTNSNMNNMSMNNTSTNNSNNNGNVGPCEVSTTFFGQIDSDFDDHAGGAPTTDALTTDAGLQTLMAEFEGVAEDSAKTVDVDITGATVIATNFGNGGNVNFWVQDANEAIQFFLGFDGCSGGTCANAPTADTIKVGDIVNFTVTEIFNFGTTPQIQAVTDFTIASSGNPVPYTDLTGQTIDSNAHYARLVRIGGRLSEMGEACGGSSTCFDLMHGDQVIEYRINADNSNTFGGDCVTYFGPLNGFPGPLSDDGNVGDPQLNVVNFSWRLPIFD